MKEFDFIFVVLTYRNTDDLRDFFRHFHLQNSKVIVVNSFFDEKSEVDFKTIANIYQADFLSVPNKGYGAGNNRGCQYALEHYLFKYLVVSNADIMIDSLSLLNLEKYHDNIIAPRIINLSGKNQNPSIPFKPGILTERFRYWIYSGNHSKLIRVYFVISRLKKILYYCIKSFRNQIFSAHGAFVIFPANVIRQLYPLYNEEMFLFNEEEHLGRLALSKGIETVYASDIMIRHKEDGSMNIVDINEFEMLKQSYLVYYKFWLENRK